MTHPHPKRNFIPRAVLMKYGFKILNTARQNSSRAAVSVNTTRPINTAYPKSTVNSARTTTNVFNRAHLHVRRPFNKYTTNKNNTFNEKVNTVKGNVTTARPRAVVSVKKGNGVNAVKASTCWVRRPNQKGNPKLELQEKGVIDSGCSRHITGNKSYLSNYEEIHGRFVAFGGNSKGGKITRKGKIRTGKLDFKDVYFVKELKFNLFSVSKMCDKKNNVLFTDIECVILSFNFKLLDESQVLLRAPRKNNMYSVDLKNIVPQGGLTCLFAKATLDKSNLWHRRLGHINFKTMNKLVRGNLDETSGILKAFITGIENQINHKVKIIRCDNGTEFKNKEMNQFCEMKRIKREFSVTRTPQQNGLAERKNRTLIEAAKTMLADSKLPTTFWAEAVNTAYYVQNRVLVIKPHNKTPYELFNGRPPKISFMRPFRCPVTILNTLDHLGKFDGKADEGFFVGYSINSKAFIVFNNRTKIVEETLDITFLKNKPNIARSGPKWLFDIDTLTISMNYKPVTAGNQANGNAGIKENIDAGQAEKKTLLDQHSDDKFADDAGRKSTEDPAKEGDKNDQALRDEFERLIVQEKAAEIHINSTNSVSTASSSVNAAQPMDAASLLDDPLMPDLKDVGIFDGAYDDQHVGAEADFNNLDTIMIVSPIPTTRVFKDHPVNQIIGDLHSAPQTRRMTKQFEEHALIEPKKVIQALKDPRWIEAIQDKLLQFKLQKVWTLVDLPYGKRAIRTKWVYRNKKDERGIVVRNKARLVAQGYTQEEGIDYDEVFAHVARIEAIMLFLAYASYMDFVVYEMDVKNAFLYGKIEEEVYVCQPLGFEDPEFPNKVYRVEKALYGLHQAPRAWYETLSTYLLENGFKRGLIFIRQDKYMDEILKKFGFSTMKTASTPMETLKPLLKDAEAEDVDVHLYRSMIGSLMYLTASRHDIMFAVYACARFQVTPKVLHLHVVKRIFRYLKGQPKLGLWYPKDSPFDLEAYIDSDYAGVRLDRKSTIGGCQFLRKRLISWQCKKQTIVANSTTKVEYVAAAINAARQRLIAVLQDNAVRLNLLLLQVNDVRQKLTIASANYQEGPGPMSCTSVRLRFQDHRVVIDNVKSAIMTTAYTTDNTQNFIKNDDSADATPFDYGPGHINPTTATDPGLAYFK
ncbi:putative ribonuclease H-like domain-containing protein [Tanacetum coccineum]